MGNDQFVDFPGEWALLALGLMRASPPILHVPFGYKWTLPSGINLQLLQHTSKVVYGID